MGGPNGQTEAELRKEARRKLWNRKSAEQAPKYRLKVLRRSWRHHALRRVLDALTVSVLMGHADCSTVTKVYSHLSHAPDYLREAVRKATACGIVDSAAATLPPRIAGDCPQPEAGQGTNLQSLTCLRRGRAGRDSRGRGSVRSCFVLSR